MQSPVVVLDLDGVIIKSNLIKYRAMLSLFAEHSQHQEPISTYILTHGGVPRPEKISSILAGTLGIPVSPELLSDYLQRYALALEHELSVVPLVDGVANFLAASGYTFYVSSSAPEAEVHAQLVRRNLYQRFAHVYGADTPKENALRQIVQRHPARAVVFFGDSVGDRLAAQAANVAFVAVVNERDNFADIAVVKLSDFASLPHVQSSMEQALSSKIT